MKHLYTLIIYILFLTPAFGQKSPDIIYGALFHEVQMRSLFEDSKTFADCIPVRDPKAIVEDYKENKENKDLNLHSFVKQNFRLPVAVEVTYEADTAHTVKEHIEQLWQVLKRKPDIEDGSSLIPLPYSYIVPGGRFREIYYWDSYFTMLGLEESGEDSLYFSMLNNFKHLIDQYGFVPNGNRTYYLTRGQPPFYALMVGHTADNYGDQYLLKHLETLEKEYNFWMSGSEGIDTIESAYRRIIKMPDGEILNRYWDDTTSPRPESYREDVILAQQSERDPKDLLRNIRAACESGWDFSSRWFADGKNLSSIHITELVPIDLNSLLYYSETLLSRGYGLAENTEKSRFYHNRSQNRKAAINKYCLDTLSGIYLDYNFVSKALSDKKTLASAVPLFLNIADTMTAENTSVFIKEHLLHKGGAVTTTLETEEQWDKPNGWAPLHYMTIEGLKNYGLHENAEEIANRWIETNMTIFNQSHKLTEKYNVVKPNIKGGGGEYPLQDGFGWTNAVLLKLLSKEN
ncbi:alpha,alpha-trehalase TreF [Cytophagaceae bacterium ABcell3]|nr:alpha,alpha-trehalase TreF [Cytophagaceae bacterium ABcell3]